MARRRPFTCSFCGKSREQARRLIAGPNGVYICDECVSLCNEILAEDTPFNPDLPCARPQEEVARRRRIPWRRLVVWWRQPFWHPASDQA